MLYDEIHRVRTGADKGSGRTGQRHFQVARVGRNGGQQVQGRLGRGDFDICPPRRVHLLPERRLNVPEVRGAPYPFHVLSGTFEQQEINAEKLGRKKYPKLKMKKSRMSKRF